MLRRIRWVLIAIGLAGLAVGSASIFSIPEHEILYSERPPIVSCDSYGCVLVYILEVGNTGRAPQDSVRVRLAAGAVEGTILPVTVRTFGKVPRPFTTRDEGSTRVYDLGQLATNTRVEIRLVFRRPDAQAAPPWNEMLVGVDGTGDVRPGDAAPVTLGRWLFTLLGMPF